MKYKFLILTIIVFLAVILGILIFTPKEPGKLDNFAKCLKEQGAVFYGAFWCPHCQNQKKLFGKSEKFLPYIECSTPDGRAQTIACNEKNVKSYPTWEFKDGQREVGEVSLESLAEKTNCVLP